VKITADTNILVRAIVADDAAQAKLAQAALQRAEQVAVPSVALCEFVWVLQSGYSVSGEEIASAIRGLLASANVEANRPEAEAGLAMLEAGGDFADGVIAFQGAALGADKFVTFDRDAARICNAAGISAQLLKA
jgi:predicted nucleic-acid-binding protein